MCELMTWCFAGHTLAGNDAAGLGSLAAACHAQRLHHELAPVLRFARSRGVRTIVVSASPRAIVELAAGAWGFAARDVAASTPLVVSGVIAPHMDGALPYAAAKCAAGRALLGAPTGSQASATTRSISRCC